MSPDLGPRAPAPPTAVTTRSAQLLASLAHDARGPLAIIIGYAELLSVRDDERTRIEAALQIGRASTRLSTLLENVIALGELDASRVVLEPASVELETALAEAGSAARWSDNDASVAYDGPRELIVSADPERLRTMLGNVVAVLGAAAPETTGIVVGAGRGEGGVTITFRIAAAAASVAEPEGGVIALELEVARRLALLHGGSLEESNGALVLALPA